MLVSPAILDPLRRSLAWLLSLRDAEGRIVCPQHKVEHTGKTAGVIGLALALRLHDPEAERAELWGVAVEQARRRSLPQSGSTAGEEVADCPARMRPAGW